MSDPFAGAGKAIDPDVPPPPIPDPIEEFAKRVAERWMNSGGRYDDFIAIISSELRAGGWVKENWDASPPDAWPAFIPWPPSGRELKKRINPKGSDVPIEKPVINEPVTQEKRANPSAGIGYSS